ncbi:hypothetical protein [Streptomyces sp. NPDC002994]
MHPPIGQNPALQTRDAVTDFRLQLFDLVVALTVLIITGSVETVSR